MSSSYVVKHLMLAIINLKFEILHYSPQRRGFLQLGIIHLAWARRS